MEIKNKKAYFDYYIDEEYEAGIVLTGTEIKSIRKGSVSLKDTFARIKNNEVFLLNMFISPYKEASIYNVDERRTRKLLLNKSEIKRIKQDIEQKGLTLIPLKLYFKKDKIKLELGICRGKKNYDKRETIKQRDEKREIEKIRKNMY